MFPPQPGPDDGLRSTHTLVLLSTKDNLPTHDPTYYPPSPPHTHTQANTLFQALHSLLGFSPSRFPLSIPLYLLDTLPHQLFSGPDEMTPEGNLILIVCVHLRFCVCVVVCTDTENAYVSVSLISYFASWPRLSLPLLLLHSGFCLSPHNTSELQNSRKITHFIHESFISFKQTLVVT